MAIKTKTGYACGYCHKIYTGETGASDATKCKESHDLIFLQLSKEDLQRLVMFIYSKEDDVLGDDIVNRLQSYLKGAYSLDLEKEN